MIFTLLFFPLLVSSLKPTSTVSSQLHKPTPTVVYTADAARQQESPRDSTYQPPTAYDYDPTGPSGAPAPDDKLDNPGFVEPIDFNSFLTDVARKSAGGSGSSGSPAFSPFTSESKSKDSFAGFFDDGSRRNSYSEPHFGSLSSSASSQKARKAGDETDEGFVDPNVQFRSLFDSTETADGFQPADFLNYKGDSSGADPSKGSQTRAFPSFTYSGRQDDDDGRREYDEPSNPNDRYRSSYRQVDSRDSPQRNNDPYDDSTYYNGERDESPRGPAPPPRRYRINEDDASYGPSQGQGGNGNRGGESPAVQETAHNPQASRGKPKGAESSNGKSKCKKVEKQVDEDAEYNEYSDPNEPSENYDPSTYNSRYKRQAGRGGRSGGNKQRGSSKKRPMTCYVCEDEQGRYAERCSYDSKADPKAGSYFHSSSTSFNDKGNRPGGRDRFKRQPSLATAGSVTTVIKSSSSSNESLPKKVEKRQSDGDRYASGYGEDRDRKNGHQEGGRGPGRDRENDYYEGPEDYEGNSGEHRSNSGENQGFTPNYNHHPSSSSRGPTGGRGNSQGNRDYDFGPPSDFGRDSGQDSPGFDYDFSIPREFSDPGQLGTSNTNNRPIFSGGNNNNEFGPGPGFETGYEDYVKKYFPDAFGPTSAGPTSSSSHRPGIEASGSSPSPPRPPSGNYQPNYYHRNRDPVPERQHTQQSHNVAPRPYYNHGPEEPYEGQEHLQQAIASFGQKDRGNGCETVKKGDMTCIICRDPRGMKKEECMYKSDDPRNKQMAYHEVSEYSSLPPASILPVPKPQPAPQESRQHEVKKLPTDYDFDY